MSVSLFSYNVNEAQLKAARKVVANGAALFDEYRAGWRERIAMTSLDISSVIECALGQEFGNYDKGLDELRQLVRENGGSVGYSFSQSNGFDSGWDEETGTEISHEALTVAWREEINGHPMTTDEKFAAVLSDQVRQITRARVADEKRIETLRKSIEQYEVQIADLNKRVETFKTDEENGRALVARVLNA